MSTDYAERLPPDWLMSERENLAPDQTGADDELSPIDPTLLMPVYARACGDAMFPAAAVNDAFAQSTLRRLGTDAENHLADRAGIYAALARTRLFRSLAAQFFAKHPNALGASLGCGLGHYFQWLDNGSNQWIDVDRRGVIALRERMQLVRCERRLDAAADLSEPGWWARLALPTGPYAPPVVLICELLLMQQTPAERSTFLREFERHAPLGSQLLFDAMFWLSTGSQPRHAGFRHTGLRLTWGSRRRRELAASHPRLALLSEQPVMDGYGWPHSLIGPVFRSCFGVPFYGITQLGLRDEVSP